MHVLYFDTIEQAPCNTALPTTPLPATLLSPGKVGPNLDHMAASHDYQVRLNLSGSPACALVPYERGPTYVFQNESAMISFATNLWMN